MTNSQKFMNFTKILQFVKIQNTISRL